MKMRTCSNNHMNLFSLASFLFDNNKDDTDENYIHEAICQLLMFSSIAFVKLQKIVS